MNTNNKKFRYELVVLVIILVAGFAVRMIDLTDPPLDYHPTRQLRAAIITRSIYLQMNPAASPEQVEFATDPVLYEYITRREPPVTEFLVALIYLFIGSETLWISRIVTSLIWCVGGIALFLLVRRMTSSPAALVSVGFYMFTPFGVIGSRSFQPEALMVASMLWALYLFYHWIDNPTWKNALLAGLVTGFSIFVKPNALFPLFFSYALTVIFSIGLIRAVKNIQIWIISILAAIFPAIYYFLINPSAGGFTNDLFSTIVGVVPNPQYFLGWGSIVTDVVPFTVIILALTSTLMFGRKNRLFVIGLWIGYLVLGIVVPYHIYTHDYYSLILVPIVAISLGKIVQTILNTALSQDIFVKIGLVGIAIFAMLFSGWNVYKTLNERDFRNEPRGWELIAEEIPQDKQVVGLTHNYGFNFIYFGYQVIQSWPYTSDVDFISMRGDDLYDNFDQFFYAMVEPNDIFLVTLFQEFEAQPQLKEKLSEYPIYSEGVGYIMYDLSEKKPEYH